MRFVLDSENKISCFGDSLVQKLQQTSDVHIFVQVVPRSGEGAVLVDHLGAHQILHVFTQLTDILQLELQRRDHASHLVNEAAEVGEVVSSEFLLLWPHLLRDLQGVAGDVAGHSSFSLQETHPHHLSNPQRFDVTKYETLLRKWARSFFNVVWVFPLCVILSLYLSTVLREILFTPLHVSVSCSYRLQINLSQHVIGLINIMKCYRLISPTNLILDLITDRAPFSRTSTFTLYT